MIKSFTFLYFGCVLLFTNCKSSQPTASITNVSTTPITMQNFDKQGHRGCRGLMPENTIPAMLKALDLGVTTLEMDIVFSKDHVPLLSHEPFFNHEITTLPNGDSVQPDAEKNFNIYNLSFSETQQYDVGLKLHPRFPQQTKIAAQKPSLAAVFSAVAQYMKTSRRPFPYFNIETKTQKETDNLYHPAPEKFVDLLMQCIHENGMEQWVTIQSFDIRTLQYLHAHYPTIATALLIEDFDQRSIAEQLKELGFLPTIYSPHYSLLNAEKIKELHQQNIKVIPWTVNDLPTIQHLQHLQVDGIITDYPNLF